MKLPIYLFAIIIMLPFKVYSQDNQDNKKNDCERYLNYAHENLKEIAYLKYSVRKSNRLEEISAQLKIPNESSKLQTNIQYLMKYDCPTTDYPLEDIIYKLNAQECGIYFNGLEEKKLLKKLSSNIKPPSPLFDDPSVCDKNHWKPLYLSGMK
ncbi:MAG: hypothetical protein KBD78_13740 [Oligoflexales bacterium]|nr:hypothetical protein [Alphaproteobacteria bacterium]MBP9708696.1 hypothetical protein [Oligoflexales bacterium]